MRAWYKGRRMLVTCADFVNKEYELLGYDIQEGEDATVAPFDEVTVERYIGISDIYGTEICEGDILQETAPRGNKYLVFAVPGGFAINVFQDEISEETDFYTSIAEKQNAGFISENCKIIGNKQENPELLTNRRNKK